MNFYHSRYYTLDLDEINICVECIESYIGEYYGISSFEHEKNELEILLDKLKAVLKSKDNETYFD